MLTVSTTINPEKACCGISTRVHPHFSRLTLGQYTTWLAAHPTAGFFQSWLLLILFAPSNLVRINTVVQHWLLAIDCDHIAVDFSFESPSMDTSYKFFHALAPLHFIHWTHTLWERQKILWSTHPSLNNLQWLYHQDFYQWVFSLWMFVPQMRMPEQWLYV